MYLEPFNNKLTFKQSVKFGLNFEYFGENVFILVLITKGGLVVMNNCISSHLFMLGAGFVAGAILVSNNSDIRKWFTSSTKKMAEAYEDMMRKVDEKLGSVVLDSSSEEDSDSTKKTTSNKSKN